MFFESTLLFTPAGDNLANELKGGFARRVAVLFTEDAQHPDNQAFLTRVLAAAQINLENDTLYAALPAAANVQILPVLKNKLPETVLVFGLSPRQLGLNIDAPQYTPFPFYGTTWLFSEPLSLLEPDKNRKGILWRALQQLFL